METDWLESSFSRKNVQVLADKKLAMNKQCIFAAKVNDSSLGCIRRSIPRRLAGGHPSSLPSTGKMQLVCRYNQDKKCTDKPEQVLPKATKLIMVWEHLSYKGILRDLGLLSQENRRLSRILAS